MNRWQRAMRVVVRLLLAALILAAAGVAAAAPGRQDVHGTLSFDDPAPVTGSLDATTPEHRYAFECTAGDMAALVVETTSGALRVDLGVEWADGTVQEFAALSGLGSATVAEGLLMPASGRCVATLTRAGDTTGSYSLYLRHGFGRLAVWDTFSGTDDPLALVWEDYESANMRAALGADHSELQILTDNLFGYHVPEGDAPIFDDLYVQVDAAVQGTPSYFEYGVALRLNVADEREALYAVTFSSDDDFAVYYLADGEWTAIQEWTVSPAIDTSVPQARIAVAVEGSTFRLYFNDAFVAEVEDPERHAAEGTIALAAATGADQTDTVTVHFDNLMITTPYAGRIGLPFGGDGTAPAPTPTGSPLSGLAQALGGTRTPAPSPSPVAPTASPSPVPPTPTPAPRFPAAIAVAPRAAPAAAMEALRQAGVAPAGGELALSVPTSYGDTSASGFSSYPLGQGRTFRNFVLSFNARLVATGPGSGCGMYFRTTDDVSYSALAFADRYAMLGEWSADGSLTDLSTVEVTDAVVPGQGAFNHIVIIALEEQVAMYVNGQLFAAEAFAPITGGVALEMYVEPDEAGGTQQTYCQLNNIWLWEF